MNKFVLFIVCLLGGLSLHAQTPVTYPNSWPNLDHFDALEFSDGNHMYIGGRSSEGPITWNAYPGDQLNHFRFAYSNAEAAQLVYIPWNGHWSFRVSDNSPSYSGLVTWRNVMTISRYNQVDIEGSLTVNDGAITIHDGTQNQFKVDHTGYLRCREILIDMTSIPDYVFEPDYKLMPLSDLREYIKTEKHLPNIPSAAEYEERGKVALGEMNRLLLEKVEELTLYTLDLEEKMQKLEQKLEKLATSLSEE